jgi:hypothetical protein
LVSKILESIVNMKADDVLLQCQEPVDSNSEEAAVPETQTSLKRVWYRSVPFQIAVASGVSFTAPGMWDALGGLGAGGAAEPVRIPILKTLQYI